MKTKTSPPARRPRRQRRHRNARPVGDEGRPPHGQPRRRARKPASDRRRRLARLRTASHASRGRARTDAPRVCGGETEQSCVSGTAATRRHGEGQHRGHEAGRGDRPSRGAGMPTASGGRRCATCASTGTKLPSDEEPRMKPTTIASDDASRATSAAGPGDRRSAHGRGPPVTSVRGRRRRPHSSGDSRRVRLVTQTMSCPRRAHSSSRSRRRETGLGLRRSFEVHDA